jgi:putative cardiolipin synthase
MWRWAALAAAWLIAAMPAAAVAGPMAAIDAQLASHPGQTGVHVLETGKEALEARAWLVDNAERTIEAQYFIWSTDNIGILAAEALLRAADRGVKVRVIVDDLLIKAPDESLLALSLHANIDIKVYNPRHSVGTPIPKRVMNALIDFRGFNQRMHDKLLIVDGKVAITGGRNMAAEYFDYHHGYNFRDRDALVLGEALGSMRASFERFWASELCVSVEERFDGLGLLQKSVRVDDAQVQAVYRQLHAYARSPENFAAEVREAIRSVPQAFDRVAAGIEWGRVEFISDRPGKNDSRFSLGGGGAASRALAQLARGARQRIVIQSPYVVLSPEAVAIMREALARGVRIRISTNSLASTDNLQAFSGYRNQRDALVAMGLEIFEYRPDPEVMRELMRRAAPARSAAKPPIFAIHAKTMVVDGKILFVGTYNFDPRSQNLNTEAGIAVYSEALAASVERAIEIDMRPANSWNAAKDHPDRHAPATKRGQVRFWQSTPIAPLL